MPQTFYENVVLIKETCCVCGTPFSMEQNLYGHLKKHGGTFYCSNGHPQHYVETTDQQIERLQAEIRSAKCETLREKNLREQAERKLARTGRRIKNGVCPCCNRSFSDLQRHMAVKHKEFKP